MDFYMHMIWPREALLQGVILLLMVVVALVIIRCITLYYRITTNINTIEKLGDTADQNGVAYLENSLKLNNISYEATFAQFEQNNGRTSANAPIFEHLKIIYDAGRKSSRLDADLLVKNTIDKICTGVDTIKSCISVFLVIGILGTLLGLGLSIGSFNGDSFIVNAQANNTAQELSKLFGNLRGAFAPSMWGVFMTIVFVIFYTVVIQELGINRLADRLTSTTLKIWLPTLYPTDFQKGETTMVKLNNTIRSADAINEGVKELQDNLVETNETVAAMNGMASAVSSSADKIAATSDKLVVMQEAIEKLSEQIQTQNLQIQEQNQHTTEWINNAITKNTEWINNAVAQISSYQNQGHEKLMQQADAVNANFAAQGSQLQDIVDSIKKYDENVLLTQDKLQQNLQVASEMSEPINKSLEEMTKRLGTIGANLDKIDNPLNSSAQQIQTMFGHMLDTMRENNKMMMDTLAAKEGISPELIESLQSSISGNTGINEAVLLEKMDAMITAVKEQANNVVVPSDTDNSKLLAKMDQMIRAIQSQQNSFARANDGVANPAEPIVIEQAQQTTLGKLAQIMPIAIAVLLAISIGVQCWMVTRIGDLQESQNTVNQVLIKGEKTEG